MTLSAICYALGYLTGLAAFVLMARRRNLATAGIMAIMGAGLLGGLLGANLAQWVFGGTELFTGRKRRADFARLACGTCRRRSLPRTGASG